jgi:hypothetical protein
MNVGFDVIAGYHLSPFTCGVARFNQTLADQIGLPVVSLFELRPTAGRPLLSIKLSEMQLPHRARFGDAEWIDGLPAGFGLFLHDFVGDADEIALVERAGVVFGGNAELCWRLRPYRPDVIEAFCPGTLNLERPDFQPDLKVFTFAMAHKVRAEPYRRLNRLLRRTGLSYGLYVSTALHEEMAFDEAVTGAFDGIREVFEGPVHFLGFLSDEAVAAELARCAFLAAFFPSGCRANNTTVNAALAAGVPVVTNLDEWSPPYLRHDETVIDIDRCDELPDAETRRLLAERGRLESEKVGWPGLLRVLGAGASASQIRHDESSIGSPPGGAARS